MSDHGEDPLTQSLEDALGRRILDALEDLWTHANPDQLHPSTIHTLELLEDLHHQTTP